jgi:hypothetical protein
LGAFNKTHQEIIPLAALLLPALKKAMTSEVEAARYVAALRCVEAIRLYAAGHHDQLPQKLSDITEVPIPNDPMTGQPFAYEVSGDHGSITSSSPPGGSAVEGLHWEIQIAAGKQ